jgi:gliding motility-associated-like protein
MNIEELFKEKMSNYNIKAPENLWNKIENNLNQVPQSSNIDTNAQNIITNTSSTLTTTVVKTLAISFGVATSAIGGYLIYDNFQEDTITPQTITETIPQTIIETKATFDTTPIILTKTSPITKQETIEVDIITKDSIINIPTTTNPAPISKQETIIEETPQTKLEPTPAQAPIVESTPIEETTPIVKEETIIRKEEFNPEIKRPNFVSPNNDGINDIFKIENLESYPDNEIVIFDQRGRIVFTASPYNNDWDASNIEQGTYFYKLLIKEGLNKKIFNGSITIKR